MNSFSCAAARAGWRVAWPVLAAALWAAPLRAYDFVSMVGTFDIMDLPEGLRCWDLCHLYTTGEIRFLRPGMFMSLE